MIKSICEKLLLWLSILVVSLILIKIIDGPEPEWRFSDIPSQSGRVVLVTGANAGIGFETSRHMALKDAIVIMACRSLEKCNKAADKIRKEYPNAQVVVLPLDLSQLSSVDKFVGLVKEKFKRLDILVNNAGVMAIPFSLSADKFETHFATNHLGHFSLTLQLLPLLNSTSTTPNPKTGKIEPTRIVTVTSVGERIVVLSDPLNLGDLNWETRDYAPYSAYFASKSANVFFFKELHRRLSAKNMKILSTLAHPGFSHTELQQKSENDFSKDIVMFLVVNIAQSAEMGAAPLLYSATAKGVKGGNYFGPHFGLGLKGWPKLTGSSLFYDDPLKGKELWELSEKMTKQKF